MTGDLSDLFITGASSGYGLALARYAIGRGYNVVANDGVRAGVNQGPQTWFRPVYRSTAESTDRFVERDTTEPESHLRHAIAALS